MKCFFLGKDEKRSFVWDDVGVEDYDGEFLKDERWRLGVWWGLFKKVWMWVFDEDFM